MSDNSQPDVSQNNEQIINDIQTLQQMEQKLFNSLEINTNLTSDQQSQIVEKINQLSNMRINLYQTVSGMNDFFQNSLSSTMGTLQQQSAAVGIVENELNQSKKRLEFLEAEKNNKIRLVQINDYYGDKYAEHSQLMKIIIFILVPVIIITLLKNKGILPSAVYYILLIIISLIGGVFFWYKMFSIIKRDNMNYQTYNWAFDPNNIPTTTTDTTSSSDPWGSIGISGTCIGEACCAEGQTYDAELNQCVIESV